MLHAFIVSLYGETTYQVLAIFFRFYPLWLPLLLGWLFWEVWMRFIQYSFFFSIPTVLLEVKLPKEITKSPAAMELVLDGLYQTSGESTFVDRYWLGKTRPWFSLELVSFEGEIHFYIWTRQNMRNIVESQIYAQYPEVEVKEAEDYAKKVKYDPEKTGIWATNYRLANPNPLPLRTYVDFGLDKNPDTEFVIDPITTMLEFFNTVKPGENLWLQFVIRAHKSEKRDGFFSKKSSWAGDIKKLRAQILKQQKDEGRSRPSQDEIRILDGLQRSLIKYSFDVGIRCLYVADQKVYNGGFPGYLRGGIFRPFTAQFAEDITKYKAPEPDKPAETNHFAGYNNFAIYRNTDTDFPWQDFMNIRMNYQKRHQLDAYKRRMFFYSPYQDTRMVMTTETLATLFHFPGSFAATPGLTRIQSKRGQAPSNLPT